MAHREEGRMEMDTKSGVKLPQTEECKELQDCEKGKEAFSPKIYGESVML